MKLHYVVIAMVLTAGIALTARSAPSPDPALQNIDADHDGTISMEEASKAAMAKLAALDVDHDGTLDVKELIGAVNKSTVKKLDKDADGTLDLSEFLAVVSSRFKKADKDGDGTLDANELASPHGQSLVKLLQY